MKVGVFGATGYVGQLLVTYLVKHPYVDIKFLSSKSYVGQSFSTICPKLKGVCHKICCDTEDGLLMLDEVDLVFLALPHGHSSKLVPKLKGVKVIDLGGDFRLKDKAVIKDWYGMDQNDTWLNKFAYGLSEFNANGIKNSDYIANPGCYPTAAILGLLPIIGESFVDTNSIIIDAKSGVSGAGRKVVSDLMYCSVNENIKAYGIGNHRHTPEIEQVLSQQANRTVMVSFTPHLVPMDRGILVTSYLNITQKVSQETLNAIFKKFYEHHSFVRVLDDLPQTHFVKDTNYCDVYVKVDHRTQRIIVVSVIDNLVKGSAGAAIQNMNIMFDWPIDLGL